MKREFCFDMDDFDLRLALVALEGLVAEIHGPIVRAAADELLFRLWVQLNSDSGD